MYIELYLLDNLLMNLLLLRAAAAILGRRIPNRRLAIAAALGAMYGLCSLVWPRLGAFLPKLTAGFCMSLFLCGKKEGGEIRLSAFLALLLACFLLGGLGFCLLLLKERQGISVRLALLFVLLAVFLPNPLRKLLRRQNRIEFQIRIEHKGRRVSLPGMLDTGDLLFEPLSGLPVAVAFLPLFQDEARIPIPVRTVNGEKILFAFRPQRVLYGEEIPLDLLLALSPEPMDCILLPPSALPILKREVRSSC